MIIKIGKIRINPYLILGIMLPVCVAGLRDYSIGVDVKLYAVPSFQRALNISSVSTFLEYQKKGGLEVFFSFFTYFVSKLFRSPQILLGSYELVIVCFTYAAFSQLDDIVPPYMGMLYFYFLCYNRTLSTIRQMIASAITFFAISLIIKDVPKRKIRLAVAVALIAFSFGFHASAVFGAAILTAYCIIRKFGKKINFMFLTVAILVCFIAVNRFKSILPLLRKIASLLSGKYLNDIYYNISNEGWRNNTSYIICTLYIIAVLIVLLISERKKSLDVEWVWIQTMLYFNVFLLFLLVFISQYSFVVRLAIYIQFLWPTVLPQTVKLVKQGRYNEFLANVVTTVPIVSYWWFYYVHLNIYETVPYVMF